MKVGKFNLLAMRSKHGHFFGEGELDGIAIITGLLKTAYKLDNAAIESIIKHGKIAKVGETLTEVATTESIIDAVASLDKTRIATLKETEQKEGYQKGYGKAKGETLAEREKKVKEKYGVESDLTGDDLDDFIIAQKAKGTGTTDDDIKKSVVYQQMEARLKKEAKDAKDAGENKVKELETTYQKESTYGEVDTYAVTFLNGLKPVLPDNATVAATQIQDFKNELRSNGYTYEKKDGKTLVFKDGKLQEDGHGNTLLLDEHLKNIAGKRFVFAVNNGGENAGDKKDPKAKDQTTAYPAGVNKPKNIDELSALVNNGKLTGKEKGVVIKEFEDRTVAK